MSESQSTQEIWGEISQIAANFSLLECDKCAIAVMEWLNRNNVPGKVLKLRAKRRRALVPLDKEG